MSKNGIDKMNQTEIAALRAEERLKGKNAYEAIREYYMADVPIDLNEKQQEIHRRIRQANTLLLDGKLNVDIVNELMKQFEISHETAYKDIRWAKRIYGDVQKSSKEGERRIIYEMQKKILHKCIEAENYTEANKAIKNMYKVMGLDKEDPDLPDFSKMEPSVYPIVLDDEIRVLLLNALKQGSVDVSDLLNQTAEDVEYEEINQDAGGADQRKDQ